MTGRGATGRGRRGDGRALADRRVGHFRSTSGRRRFRSLYRAALNDLPITGSRLLETGWGRVRSYRLGPGPQDGEPSLVLIPGRNASSPVWAPVLPALLEAGLGVHALDGLTEAGGSRQHRPVETVADQVGWLAEAVRALGPGRPHLVGHSLGGWLATQVALHRPEVVASVTVLDPPQTLVGLSPGFVLAGLAASAPVVPTALRRRLLRWVVGGDAPPPDPVLEDLGIVSVETFRSRQPAPVLPRPDELAGVGAPVLAVLGGRSRVHDAATAARRAEALGWQTELWPDAGHDLHARQPDRLAELLVDFTRTADADAGRAGAAAVRVPGGRR